MKRALGLLASMALALTAGVLTTGNAGAAATTTPVVPLFQNIELPSYPTTKGFTNVYVIHGLNLDGQDAQSDGGTNVTVCAGGAELIGDFEFGDVVGPVELEALSTVDIEVFLGAGVACDTAASPVIAQTVTVPEVLSAALVATSGPGTLAPELVPFVLDTDAPEGCLNGVPAQLPDGRLFAAHAAAAPEVSVLVDDGEVDTLAYGDSLDADLMADTYSVAVELGGTPIVGPADVEVGPCELVAVYVVGNQTLPDATTTTTAPTTTTAAAAAAAATPRFTG
jgi:hypothetical protein